MIVMLNSSTRKTSGLLTSTGHLIKGYGFYQEAGTAFEAKAIRTVENSVDNLTQRGEWKWIL